VNDVTVFNRLEITPHRFFTPKKNEVEKKPVSTFFRSPVRPPPPPAVCQFLHFHFYPPVRAPVRPPPPVSAPPPNPVHPPQPPPLAPPRTLDPPLPVPSPAARPPGGLKPSLLPSSNQHRRPPIDTAVDHLPVVVLRAPSSDPSINFIAAIVAGDHAIPYRPLAMLAPPPRVDMLPHPPPSDPPPVSSPASVAARLAR
jgi:hypothetical protein